MFIGLCFLLGDLTIRLKTDYASGQRRSMMKTLQSGDKAPYFDLKDQSGHNVRLSDYAGKKLFIYFYPKANTSG